MLHPFFNDSSLFLLTKFWESQEQHQILVSLTTSFQAITHTLGAHLSQQFLQHIIIIFDRNTFVPTTACASQVCERYLVFRVHVLELIIINFIGVYHMCYFQVQYWRAL